MPKSVKTEKEFAKKSIRNPFNFSAPSYDDRNEMNAGNLFGVGYKQPIGHTDGVKQNVECLPQKRYVKSANEI